MSRGVIGARGSAPDVIDFQRYMVSSRNTACLDNSYMHPNIRYLCVLSLP